MPINKPYKRIICPFIDKDHVDYWDDYVLDTDYSFDRSSTCLAYKLIEGDLRKILEFIEPGDDNSSTYSHKVYELFIRASTEFESNCRSILDENLYPKHVKSLNIKDYYRLNNIMKLSKYEVALSNWRINDKNSIKIIKPFDNWNYGNYLKWYQEYNEVKHNRYVHFKKATLLNAIYSVSGLFILLFAQYGYQIFNSYQPVIMVTGNNCDFQFSQDSFFRIKSPEISSWLDNEKYDFCWEELENIKDRFNTVDWSYY